MEMFTAIRVTDHDIHIRNVVQFPTFQRHTSIIRKPKISAPDKTNFWPWLLIKFLKEKECKVHGIYHALITWVVLVTIRRNRIVQKITQYGLTRSFLVTVFAQRDESSAKTDDGVQLYRPYYMGQRWRKRSFVVQFFYIRNLSTHVDLKVSYVMPIFLTKIFLSVSYR